MRIMHYSVNDTELYSESEYPSPLMRSLNPVPIPFRCSTTELHVTKSDGVLQSWRMNENNVLFSE